MSGFPSRYSKGQILLIDRNKLDIFKNDDKICRGCWKIGSKDPGFIPRWDSTNYVTKFYLGLAEPYSSYIEYVAEK